MAEKSQGLVRTIQIRPDDMGTAFFKNAYRAARTSEDDKRIDAERLRGACLRIATDRRLNLQAPEDRGLVSKIVSCAVALGLADASEENMATAVAILKQKPIYEVVIYGLDLLSELRAEVDTCLRVSVINAGNKNYGLLDIEQEQELRRFQNPHAITGKREEYLGARQRVKEFKTICGFAPYLPIRQALEARTETLQPYLPLVARKAHEKKQIGSGLVPLFIRSYMVRAMTSKRRLPIYPNSYDGEGISAFLHNNFITPPEEFGELVQDVFFDPEKMRGKVIEAIPVFVQYAEASISVWGERFSFDKKPYKEDAGRDTVVSLADRFVHDFLDRVRRHFLASENEEVTDSELYKTWVPWVMLSKVQSVKARVEMAEMKQLGVGLEMIMKFSPRELFKIRDVVLKLSSEDLLKLGLEYSWDRIEEERGLDWNEKMAMVVEFTEMCGARVLESVAAVKKELQFWLVMWGKYRSVKVHDAILGVFEKREMKTQDLKEYMSSVGGCGLGGDDRLHIKMLGEYLTRPVRNLGKQMLHSFFWHAAQQLRDDREAMLRRIYNMIPVEARAQIFDSKSLNDQTIMRMIGIWRGGESGWTER